MMVGADVTLALSASMVVLACSLCTMPLFFTLGMWLYVLLGGAGEGQEVTVQLPVAQIAGAMALLIVSAGDDHHTCTSLYSTQSCQFTGAIQPIACG